MTKARVLFGLTVMLTLTAWMTVRSNGRASAQTPLVADPFTEDNAAHRFASSQARHWRQMLNHH